MLIIGLVVGAIAKLLMPGKDPGGFIVTMLIGIAGALLAGMLGRALGWYESPGEGPGIIASVRALIGVDELHARTEARYSGGHRRIVPDEPAS